VRATPRTRDYSPCRARLAEDTRKADVRVLAGESASHDRLQVSPIHPPSYKRPLNIFPQRGRPGLLRRHTYASPIRNWDPRNHSQVILARPTHLASRIPPPLADRRHSSVPNARIRALSPLTRRRHSNGGPIHPRARLDCHHPTHHTYAPPESSRPSPPDDACFTTAFTYGLQLASPSNKSQHSRQPHHPTPPHPHTPTPTPTPTPHQPKAPNNPGATANVLFRQHQQSQRRLCKK
jgi:hypothetical protein